MSQVKSQSSEVTARASRPVKEDIQPPLRTVVVPCALKKPAEKVESSDAWRKSPDQGPPRVHSKKPRKVLFEPTASERELDEEGNSGSFQLYFTGLNDLSMLLGCTFSVHFSMYL